MHVYCIVYSIIKILYDFTVPTSTDINKISIFSFHKKNVRNYENRTRANAFRLSQKRFEFWLNKKLIYVSKVQEYCTPQKAFSMGTPD